MCVLKITFKEINKISNTSSKSVAKKTGAWAKGNIFNNGLLLPWK